MRPPQVLLDAPGELRIAPVVLEGPFEVGAGGAALAASIECMSHQDVVTAARRKRTRAIVMLRDHQDAARIKVCDRSAIREVRDASDHPCSRRPRQRWRIESLRPRAVEATAGRGQDLAQTALPAHGGVALGSEGEVQALADGGEPPLDLDPGRMAR